MPPSTTASTRRSRTTSRRRCIVPRYRATAPREATRNDLIRPRSVVRASVSPSLYQDCAVSREKFASGSTASDRIPPALALGHSRPRESLPPETTSPTKAVTITAGHKMRRPRGGAAAAATFAARPDAGRAHSTGAAVSPPRAAGGKGLVSAGGAGPGGTPRRLGNTPDAGAAAPPT